MLDGLMGWLWQLAAGLIQWGLEQVVAFLSWWMGLLNGGVGFLLDGIEIPEPPQWLVDAPAAVAIVMEWAGALGHWIPWPVAVTVALSVLGCLIAGLVIQAVRIVASFFSLGGGAT